jgi:hypothetical protein
MTKRPYSRLLLMVVLSFVSMYVLMYAMVNAFANVYLNANQVYMAGLMAAPMAIIELALSTENEQEGRGEPCAPAVAAGNASAMTKVRRAAVTRI